MEAKVKEIAVFTFLWVDFIQKIDYLRLSTESIALKRDIDRR